MLKVALPRATSQRSIAVIAIGLLLGRGLDAQPPQAAYPSTERLGYPANPPNSEALRSVDAAPEAELLPPGSPAERSGPATSGPAEPVPAAAAARPAWYSLDNWFGPTPWDTSIELGLNGTQGTNDALSIRAGGDLDRQTEWNKIDIDLAFNKASANRVETQNNTQFDVRHDWLFPDSPWTIFAATSLLYDEFQAFDIRYVTNGGLGYAFIDTEPTSLIGRFGAGTSREFGGPDNRWVPEALLGLELDHDINARQKVYGKVDYLPDWNDFGSYRIVTDGGYEVLLSEESNVSLKLSVSDRFDSTPNGAEANLLNYSVLLLWKL